MEIHEIRSEIKKMSERINQFKDSLNVEQKEAEIKEYDDQMQVAGFWDDQRKAQEVINAANAIKDKVNTFYSLEGEVEELAVAFELILEEPEMIKQGSRFGVKLKATAPSIHIIRPKQILFLSTSLISKPRWKFIFSLT